MTGRFVRTLGIVFALVLVAGTSGNAFDGDLPRKFIIFGDSLSDSGNHFLAFHQVSTRPFVPEPDAPYLIGGFHFSNGRTWVEKLTAQLGIPKSGLPALAGPGHFTNYAVGRARARAGAPEFPDFDLGTQVDRFLTDFGHAPSQALYVIWIASNDVGDFLLTISPADQDGDETILQAAGAAIAGSVQTLALAAARRFLVLNVPNPALTPLVATLPAPTKALVAFLTQQFNAGVAGALTQVKAGLAPLGIEIDIIPFDADAALTAIVADPEEFGLTNATDSCLAFGVVVHVICRAPNDYLFWDGTHPTTAAHGILAKQVKEALLD
jgi:phospholipase/lecithinase/hemolysin